MRECAGRRMLQRLALLAIPLAALLAGCTLFNDPAPVNPLPPPSPPTGNLLTNGDFGAGQPPWTVVTSEDGAAAITTDAGHAAAGAAGLSLGSGAPATTGIAAVNQRIETTVFPEFLSGFYRVDAWQPAAAQYLQVVLTVRGGDFADGLPVHELRLPLAGLQYEPVAPPEVRFQFVSRAAPAIGAWTYFAYPIKQAFLTKWDAQPSRWDAIELSFEVRYDDGPPEHPAGTARVLYDDLYAGPQISNPNRPPDP